MVYNSTVLSSRTTVQGLQLQADQVGELHLKLRIQGGGNLYECEKRESPVTHQRPQVSQRAIEIIKRDFTIVAAGSSTVPKQRFPELLELHLARKPTPAEVALLTLRCGDTGLQLENRIQWLQSDEPVVAATSADPDQPAASDPTNLGSNLCRGNVSSVESTACVEKPVEMEPHIIANAKATFKALDVDGDGESHLPTLSTRHTLRPTRVITF